jgi:N-formylglutamate amidohydrolase
MTVAANRPFAGTLVPANHYRTDSKVKSIMIEVNRRTYMDESTGERLHSFERTRQGVGKLLSAATALVLEELDT